MSGEVKTMVEQFLRNPALAQSLVDCVRNPAALARAAGASDGQLTLLSSIGNTLTELLGRVAQSQPSSSSARRISPPSPTPLPTAPGCASNRSTALVGVLSLVAVTGAIAALGTVSAVALGNSRKQPS